MRRRPAGNLWRDERGASAIEFALIGPVLLGLLIGAFSLSGMLAARNAVAEAVDEAARTASLDPTPNDAAIRSVFTSSVLASANASAASLTVTRTTSGAVTRLDLAGSYPYQLNLIFQTTTITLTANRTVFAAS